MILVGCIYGMGLKYEVCRCSGESRRSGVVDCGGGHFFDFGGLHLWDWVYVILSKVVGAWADACGSFGGLELWDGVEIMVSGVSEWVSE